jgi:hypothetical protein
MRHVSATQRQQLANLKLLAPGAHKIGLDSFEIVLSSWFSQKSPDGLGRIGAGEGSFVGLTETLREVVRTGFGDDVGFLEGALFAFFDEDALVVGAAHGEFDGFVLPGAEKDGVC